MPISPIYWYTYVQLERESIKDTLEVNLLSQTDLPRSSRRTARESLDGLLPGRRPPGGATPTSRREA